MKALGFLTSALLFLGLAVEASAQTPAPAAPAQPQPPNLVGTFRDWSSFWFENENGETCFAGSQPSETQPRVGADGQPIRRDPIWFYVSTTPGVQKREEPSVHVGYPLAPESKVNVTIGDQTFVLMTTGGTAWVVNPALEAALVTAMRAGQSMVVRGTSQRGTNTIDTYSLLGVSAALNSIATECPMPTGTPPA